MSLLISQASHAMGQQAEPFPDVRLSTPECWQLAPVSKLWMDCRIVQMLWHGDHASWMMSLRSSANA